jgi:5-methylcytosine-specific restriction enzyme A
MKPQKTKRIDIPEAARNYVFDRDNHTCQNCGATEKLTIDHIIPLAEGGSNDLSNLQTLCLRCNTSKGDRLNPRFQRRFT